MPLDLHSGSPDFGDRFDGLVTRRRGVDADVGAAVQAIIADLRADGDAALLRLTARFDRHRAESVGDLRLSGRAIAEACDRVPADLKAAVDLAADRIEAFHVRQRPAPLKVDDPAGLSLSHRWTPIQAAGIYVPGGLARYPSTLLMNAIPARVAGVSRIVMVSPTPDGQTDPLVLYAAARAGVSEIWRIGGAQAVAALAYGTETIAPVDKIVGPGNLYVTEAKRQVFGTVGIDMIAGPSEILVVADAGNDPRWIAIDLLSQAEHDPAAQAILITDDAGFAEAVKAAVADWLATLSQPDVATRSWADHGAVIVVEDLAAAVPLIDRLAPEHLELALDRPEPLADRVRNAGTIFLGRQTPEAIGDYVAGTNHVLPTARSARFASGLGVTDFMKRSSVVRCDADGLRAIGPAAVTLAHAEGLEAHARSIAIRLDVLGDGPHPPDSGPAT